MLHIFPILANFVTREKTRFYGNTVNLINSISPKVLQISCSNFFKSWRREFLMSTAHTQLDGICCLQISIHNNIWGISDYLAPSSRAQKLSSITCTPITINLSKYSDSFMMQKHVNQSYCYKDTMCRKLKIIP